MDNVRDFMALKIATGVIKGDKVEIINEVKGEFKKDESVIIFSQNEFLKWFEGIKKSVIEMDNESIEFFETLLKF
jgi:hypothetical protein